jgi:hypothetical protein
MVKMPWKNAKILTMSKKNPQRGHSQECIVSSKVGKRNSLLNRL